jgi:hypothetical protein
VSSPGIKPDPTSVGTLERIIALARRGHARYSERAAAFSRWLREQFAAEDEAGGAPGGSRLRRLLAMRHLVQRQQAYRRAGGRETTLARRAHERAATLAQRTHPREN